MLCVWRMERAGGTDELVGRAARLRRNSPVLEVRRSASCAALRHDDMCGVVSERPRSSSTARRLRFFSSSCCRRRCNNRALRRRKVIKAFSRSCPPCALAQSPCGRCAPRPRRSWVTRGQACAHLTAAERVLQSLCVVPTESPILTLSAPSTATEAWPLAM